ncbi:MAG TPA: DUF1573 domain-containing protein [Sedimentisphaerales bacterium]|nr:DUF1573 domain-containing protein [Sedimentisphaerales bacterium]
MKRNCFKKFGIVFVVGCVLLAHVGCQEQAKQAEVPKITPTASAERHPVDNKVAIAPVAPASDKGPSQTSQAKAETTSVPNKPAQKRLQPAAQSQGQGPEITFEKLMHDFGDVAPGTTNTYEFKFTNTGNALLKIGKIKCSCGCTVAKLIKKEYAPGESGALKIMYSVGSRAGSARKTCSVPSNDRKKRAVTLTVKARVAMKVEHQPERLNLLLNKENAGCPEITLTSRDNKPFAVTRFKSTGDSITAEYNPSMKATKFVLKPKVDIEKLRTGLRGQVEIDLTHPGCKKITIVFDTLAEFKLDPRIVYVREAEPQKPVTKKVWVFSNYSEDFEVESTSSKNGTIKVLTQKKVRNGYEFELQITPPDIETKRRVFTDVFSVKIKGGQQLQITCYGIYLKKAAKSPT